MENLPKDPIILYSFINTKLRDNYQLLSELCDDMNISQSELEEKMQTVGYKYDAELNKFM